jgi:phage shock protein PspC (stress-responsive transcriptional regulator)
MQMTQPPTAAPRLLRRSTSDRVFGGVCGGLGRYWNVDPVVLRVVFGVSLLLGGFGLFAYLAMWWIVPDDSAPDTAKVNPSWLMVGLGAIAAVIAGLIGLGLLFSDGGSGILLGGLIAGLVVWIVLSQRTTGQTAAQVPPEPGYAYGGTTGYPPAAAPPPPPAPPRDRSYLGLIGLCAAIAATGFAMLVSGDPVTVLAAGLLALGATLVVGAFLGRARWLLVFAVPLLMLLAAVGQVQRLDINAGDVTWTPTSAENSYSLTAGALDVDFSQWQGQPGLSDSVSIDAGLAEVRIAAPRNWDLVLVTDFGAGELQIDEKTDVRPSPNGTNRTLVPASSGRADGTLRMNVSLRAGAVIVQTGAPAAGTAPAVIETPEPATTKDTKPASPKKEKAA